jgi:CBS-domain-containing membrane protein
MSTPCITIQQNAGLEDCCRLMEEHLIRRVPVVDESGRICGIVAQADIAQIVDQAAAEVLKQVSQPTTESSHPRHSF